MASNVSFHREPPSPTSKKASLSGFIAGGAPADGRTSGDVEQVSLSFLNSPKESRNAWLKDQKIGGILKNFKFFQDLEEGVQQKLPSIADIVRYPEGTILFRQGDPPGNCYAVLSGEVGIFVKAEDEDVIESARGAAGVKRTQAETVTVMPPPESSSSSSTLPSHPALSPISPRGEGLAVPQAAPARSSFFSRRRSRSLTSVELTEDQKLMFTRNKTVEGFSTYHDASTIGRKMCVFGVGRLFGELALLQSQPRSATIKCLKDTEFLVIRRYEFDRVLKDAMAQANSKKINFLLEHVPGMRDLPPPKPGNARPHASYFFKKSSYGKGHQFLTQGTCAEDVIYVVYNGSLELRRTEPVSKAISSRIPKHASRNQCSDDDTDEAQEKDESVRKMGILLAGSVFGALPFSEPEPFTLVASSPCEVLYVAGQDFAKLPRSLLQAIQDHLANSLTWRLARLQSDRASAVKIKEPTHKKEGVPPLPFAAQAYGMKLMKNGKIHPHPMLLKGNSAQKDMLMKMRQGCQPLPPTLVAEQLPSCIKSASTSNLTSRSTRVALQKSRHRSVDKLPSLT